MSSNANAKHALNQSPYPRIDRIVREYDKGPDEDYVLYGTPMRGATLGNLFGCPPEPVGHATVAIVLVAGRL